MQRSTSGSFRKSIYHHDPYLDQLRYLSRGENNASDVLLLTEHDEVVLAEDGLRFERLTKVRGRVVPVDLKELERAESVAQVGSVELLEALRNLAVDGDD